jgi:2-dehydro-3-deoxygluconokinase
MNQNILSIGEAMLELSQAADGSGWQLGVAGDTLNTAWYLRRVLPADWRVGYFSRVGQGEFSQKMVDFLEGEGIETGHVGRDTQHEIGLYAISLKDGERSFSYWRGDSAAKRLADDPALLGAALRDAGIAYFSGITLAILSQTGRDNLRAVLAQARANGVQVIFDPNLRPRLWSDAATMCREIEAAAAISDLILPSFDDERDHFGDADPQATVARYLARGSAQVLVKNGGAAVFYGGAEGTGQIDGLPREVPVDTTSAGDSFNAGYLAARLAGANIPTAIRRAHDLSRKVICYRGALVREAV